MQTFLPYPSYKQSAKCLDNKRLGKQRVECKQIILALENPDYGWQNHPAVRMWAGSVRGLAWYGADICREWIARGFKDSLLPFFLEKYKEHNDNLVPDWLGGEIHSSHRSNLLRKNIVWYSQFKWEEPDNMEYYWPSKNN